MSKRLSGKRIRDGLLGAAVLLSGAALVVWPQQSMEAAKEGLQLCFSVIIPSLFPFFVLSALVVDLGLAGYVGRALEKAMRPLFRVPGVCASALTLGLIGGYPVGARTAVSLYEKGMCSKTEAQRLLAFCNNCGPAFILGVVGAGVFSDPRVGILLYLVHAAAAVCVGILFRFYKRKETVGSGSACTAFQARRLSVSFTQAVQNSFLSMLNICAFVVFFTVVIRLLTVSGILGALAGALSTLFGPVGMTENWGTRLLTGVLEVSSGVWSLSGEGSFRGRVILAAFTLGWAGISVHCQVLSFLGNSGLSVRTYLLGKALHGGISALLAGLLLGRFVPEGQAVSYWGQRLEELVFPDFSAAMAVSVVLAWVVWLAFFAAAGRKSRKTCGKRRRPVV